MGFGTQNKSFSKTVINYKDEEARLRRKLEREESKQMKRGRKGGQREAAPSENAYYSRYVQTSIV